MSTVWGSFVLGAADVPTIFLEPGDIFFGRAPQSGELVCMESPEPVDEPRLPDEESFQAESRPSLCRSWPDWLVDEYMMQQQQLLEYLHPAYALQVATYQLAMKGEDEE
ncbi:unnamed protein product [Protopolystoma xenopodis]|uniref:Uncharacterized protein n=1 Tax=Protopolystoma xenopodis TaxID=117903 RepID=A0A3S5C6T8_9PLAT|nr:unnamed protein product [Protopolystoma xenopodis]